MLAVCFACVYVGLQSKLMTGTLALLCAKKKEQNLGRSRAVPFNSIFTKGDEISPITLQCLLRKMEKQMLTCHERLCNLPSVFSTGMIVLHLLWLLHQFGNCWRKASYFRVYDITVQKHPWMLGINSNENTARIAVLIVEKNCWYSKQEHIISLQILTNKS